MKRISRPLSTALAILVCMMLMLLGSCAHKNPKTVIFQTLATAATTYDTSMKIIADLYADGLITENEKEDILGVAQKYHDAYHAAASAYFHWAKFKSVESEDALNAALVEFSAFYAEFIQYLKPYIIRGEKENGQ